MSSDNKRYKLQADVWVYPSMAGWYFVTIPEEMSKEIKQQFGDFKRGWGSLAVKVTLGKTVWETSIFPDKKLNAYLLPLKAEVRKKEKVEVNKQISFTLEIKV